jgi:pSer/pThr/pTyr-binding forkhead associated (FHA) protein
MSEPRLFIRKLKTGEEYALSGVVPVGREVPEGIKLVEEGVSRRHATLTVVAGTVYLEDAGSRNGTFVNANPVTAKTALKSGDRIRFDTEEFEFRADGADSNATVMRHPGGSAPAVAAVPAAPAPAPAVAAVAAVAPAPARPSTPPAAAPPPVAAPRPSTPAASAPANAPAAAAAAAPASAAPVSASRAPGSWAEVQFNTKGTDGTERFDANQLKEYLAKAKERQQRQTQLDIKEPCLVILSGTQADRTLPLQIDGAPTQEWTVGRSADSAIRLDEPGVSDRHAKIVREGARWKLVDAISSNGSYVNDLQVGMCFLAGGDTVRFGRVQCMFNLPAKSAGAAASAARGGGAGGGSKKAIVIGAAVFVVVLAIVLWLFRSKFL